MAHKKTMTSMTVFALSLGLVTSLAPVATDMYLASMPDIARYLGVTYAHVQLTLSVFLMAQGAGQLLFGPITDRFGRRWPMLAGIVIFGLSSFCAGCADSLGMLLASRFIQGLSGALLLVVCFSSVSDAASGADSAGIFAILMTIEGLAPIFAPIAGGAYLYQTVYGLRPDTFGVLFGITGGAVMLGALASNRLVRRMPVSSVALCGILLILAGTAIALLAYLSVGIPGIVAGFLIALFGMGGSEPALVSLTMSSQKQALGFTAVLMGALQLMLPSASTPISGYLLPISPVYWFLFLIAAGGVSLALILAAKGVVKRDGEGH